MKLRQLSMFAANQSICLECHVPFVGLSRNVIESWADEYDWLSPSSVRWAADSVYQQNTRFCTAECVALHRRRQVALEIERLQHKNHGKCR